MSDHELTAGLEDAVASAPGNVPLRLHLIDHLISIGRPEEALAHVEAILHAMPDNVNAFDAAVAAATAAHDPRAAAFARVAHALRAVSASSNTAPPPPETVAAAQPAPVPAPRFVDTAPLVEKSPVEAEATPPPVVDVSDTDQGQSADDQETAVEQPQVAAPEEFAIDPQSIQRPTIALRNIIGVSDVKERIQSGVVGHLRQRNGHGAGSGFLMYGPPGCGKGFFARVVAGELGAAFLPIKLSEALDWPGDPRQNIQRIFEAARAAAPCVLFLDEVDKAGRRSDAPEEPVERSIVARLVTELDTSAANRGVYVFGGAVRPWDIDMALRADGRLDRSLLVLPPDDPAREAILRFHLKDTPLSGVDVSWIVQRTQHFSGDDLLLLCDMAVSLARMDALGDDISVGPGHVTRALRDVRPSAPSWFQTAMEQAATANQGGLYDDVMTYIDMHQLI